MHDLIDAHVTRARKLRNVPDWHTTLVEELGELLLARIIAHGCKLPHDEILDLLSLDVGLNVQGLKHWLDHTRTIDQSKI
jgi:hypothetical protein